VGAAIRDHRVLEPIEAHIMIVAALGLPIVGALGALFPRSLAYQRAALAIWLAGARPFRGYGFLRSAKRERGVPGGKGGRLG
jgi:hypothetical protein